jgi:26-hydroxylase
MVFIYVCFVGVLNSDGQLWKEQRKFLHDRLRQFGMKHVGSGKEHLETRIMVRQ